MAERYYKAQFDPYYMNVDGCDPDDVCGTLTKDALSKQLNKTVTLQFGTEPSMDYVTEAYKFYYQLRSQSWPYFFNGRVTGATEEYFKPRSFNYLEHGNNIVNIYDNLDFRDFDIGLQKGPLYQNEHYKESNMNKGFIINTRDKKGAEYLPKLFFEWVIFRCMAKKTDHDEDDATAIKTLRDSVVLGHISEPVDCNESEYNGIIKQLKDDINTIKTSLGTTVKYEPLLALLGGKTTAYIEILSSEDDSSEGEEAEEIPLEATPTKDDTTSALEMSLKATPARGPTEDSNYPLKEILNFDADAYTIFARTNLHAQTVTNWLKVA